MKVFAVFALLLCTLPGYAQLPFLFSPSAKEVRQVGKGFTVDTDQREHVVVERYGMGYRATINGRETAHYILQNGAWVESPGQRVWSLSQDGKWRTATGGWVLSRRASSIVLQTESGTLTWKQKDNAWLRE